MSNFHYLVAALFLAVVGCGCCAWLLASRKDKPGPLPRWVTCPSCNGTGRNHSSGCQVCNATGELENTQTDTGTGSLSPSEHSPELIAALWNDIWRGTSPVSTDALRRAIEAGTPRTPAIDLALGEVLRRCDEWNQETKGRQFGHSRSAAFGRVRDAIDQLSLLVTGSPASTEHRAIALAVAEQLMAGPPPGTDLRTLASRQPPEGEPPHRN